MFSIGTANISLLSHALATGEVSCFELVHFCLERISRINPSLNCFAYLDEVAALAEAGRSDQRYRQRQSLGPLDGIPVAVKDNIDVQGTPTGNGFALPICESASKDAECVARLRAAGAIVLGKLNMHEGALGLSNDNPHHGATHNPFRHDFTPGGSSGGSGAAVAAGLCIAALGTDTLGSIRVPAASCGVTGLRPTSGSIDMQGIVPVYPPLDTVGPIARHASDLGLLLEILSDHPGTQTSKRNVTTVQTGYLAFMDGVEPHKEVNAALESAYQTIQQLCASTSYVELINYNVADAGKAAFLLMEASSYRSLSPYCRKNPGACSPAYLKLLEYGSRLKPQDLDACKGTLAKASASVAQLFSGIDVLVCPTTPDPPYPFSEPPNNDQSAFTALASIAGYPSVTVPSGLTVDGLPIGLQLTGKKNSDSLLVELANHFQRTAGTVLSPPENKTSVPANN